MKMQPLPILVLLSAIWTISKANPYPRYGLTDKLDLSNSPRNYDDVFNDSQLNKKSNFESLKTKVPVLKTREESNGGFNINHQTPEGSPAAVHTYSVNGPQEEFYKLPQTHSLKPPVVLHTRGFPISRVYLDLVKGINREIPTEVPINTDDISFGPSASHVATAPKETKQTQPHITFSTLKPNRGTHFYKSVDKINPKELSETTSHKSNVIQNVPEQTTPKHVSTTTLPILPPAPTLSPWLDGFGK